jgi:hypothetical protein
MRLRFAQIVQVGLQGHRRYKWRLSTVPQEYRRSPWRPESAARMVGQAELSNRVRNPIAMTEGL